MGMIMLVDGGLILEIWMSQRLDLMVVMNWLGRKWMDGPSVSFHNT